MKINEFKAEVARKELTLEEVADKIGINRATLWRKLNKTGSFTIKEVEQIAAVLELSGSRILEIFFN